MAEFEISCPYHGKLEKIVVPDAYVDVNFKGEVPCGGGTDSRPLKIEINGGSLIKVERA